jgi:WD40 repeat protein
MHQRLLFIFLIVLLIAAPVSHAQQDSPIQLHPLIVITHPGLSPSQVWRPDDEMVAIPEDYGVRLYSATYEERLFLSYPPNESIGGIAWSPNSQFLAIASRVDLDTGTLQVFQMMNDQRVAVLLLTARIEESDQIQWKPDNTQVAVGGQVFSIYTGQLIRTHPTSNQLFRSNLYWSPDGTRYVSLYQEVQGGASYGIFTDSTGDLIIELQASYSNRSRLRFFWSPDGNKITDGFRAWDTNTGALIAFAFNGIVPTGAISAVWTPDQQSIIALRYDPGWPANELLRWDATNSTLAYDLDSWWHGLKTIYWRDGVLMGRSQDGYLVHIDPDTGSVNFAQPQVPVIPSVSIAWSPDSRRLLSAAPGTSNHPMQLWDVSAIRSGDRITPVWTVNQNWWGYGTGYSADIDVIWNQTNSFVTTSGNHVMDGWSVIDGSHLQPLYQAAQLSAAISPDLRRIAQFSDNSPIEIIYPATRDVLFTLSSSEGNIARWSPDGSMLATCTDSQIIFWALTDSAGYEISRTSEYYGAAAWSPDGRWLQTLDALVDPFTGQTVHQWADELYAVSWSLDNRRFAGTTYANNPMLVIVDAYSGDELLRMALPEFAQDVAWSPDGSMIAVCYEDGSIQIWRVDQ